MEDNNANTKRIAKNTLFLYIRMVFTMVISLYSSRLVLNSLGVEDFGVYNVIGGIVSMFTILSGSLSAAVTRFLTFELGKENYTQLKKVFSTSVYIHASLSILIFLLAEVGGLWFIKNKMIIDPTRISAAIWVLHFSAFSFALNLIRVPYNALVIAHERMRTFALISVLEAFCKLMSAIGILYMAYDKLVCYGAFILVTSFIICLSFIWYCLANFSESKLMIFFDKQLIINVGSFAMWNFLGSATGVLRGHGINLLINVFCGPVVNAARGISFQVNSAVTQFANNFMKAIDPQITKSYAARNYEYMHTLIWQGARLSFYMLLLVSLPILIETQIILELWLKNVPNHTVIFVRLILVFSMIESLSGTMITAMLATGRIKRYQITIGIISFLNFPTAYVVVKYGMAPEYTVVVMIFYSICMLLARIFLLNGMIGLSIKNFMRNILLKVACVASVSYLVTYLLTSSLDYGIARLIVTCLLSVVVNFLTILYIGCSSNERKIMLIKFNRKILKR